MGQLSVQAAARVVVVCFKMAFSSFFVCIFQSSVVQCAHPHPFTLSASAHHSHAGIPCCYCVNPTRLLSSHCAHTSASNGRRLRQGICRVVHPAAAAACQLCKRVCMTGVSCLLQDTG